MTTYRPIPRMTLEEVPPLHPQASALWHASRVSGCQLCPLSASAQSVCLFGNGPVPTAGMVVSDAPTVTDDKFQRPLLGTSGVYLGQVLDDLNLSLENLYVTQAVKCLPPAPNNGRDKALETAVKACVPYLEAELAAVQPRAVLAMGATAYYFFAHKKGILKARGQAFFHEKYLTWVVPTVHPTYVMNNPAYDEAFIADVAMFKRFVTGQTADPPIDIVEVNSLEDWVAAEAELRETDTTLTFDLETRGFKDFDQPGPGYSQVWCVTLTRGRRGADGMRVFMIPLEHPDSPFLEHSLEDWEHNWTAEPLGLRVAPEYRQIVEGVFKILKTAKLNGHNTKYDVRNLQQLARRYGLED